MRAAPRRQARPRRGSAPHCAWPCTARSGDGCARRSRRATVPLPPGPRAPGSKELRVVGVRRADMLTAELRDDPAARCALQKSKLEQVRLVDVLDRVRLLAERDREG